VAEIRVYPPTAPKPGEGGCPSVVKKPKIAKRTQFSMQACINQNDTQRSNLPIKAIQTYSSLLRDIVQTPARSNPQPR
jgi:hypothetical protein